MCILYFRCFVKGCDIGEDSAYLQTWLNLTTPYISKNGENKPNPCKIYNRDDNQGESINAH